MLEFLKKFWQEFNAYEPCPEDRAALQEKMMQQEFLEILGKKVRDRVTNLEGVATSVCFDLYGCVQVIINPGKDKDGKLLDGHWFDFKRLEVMDQVPVMPRPTYKAPGSEVGAAEKPAVGH